MTEQLQQILAYVKRVGDSEESQRGALTVLFAGPKGTGKTKAMQMLAPSNYRQERFLGQGKQRKQPWIEQSITRRLQFTTRGNSYCPLSTLSGHLIKPDNRYQIIRQKGGGAGSLQTSGLVPDVFQ